MKYLFLLLFIVSCSSGRECAELLHYDANIVYKLGYWQGATSSFINPDPDSVQLRFMNDSIWFNNEILGR